MKRIQLKGTVLVEPCAEHIPLFGGRRVLLRMEAWPAGLPSGCPACVHIVVQVPRDQALLEGAFWYGNPNIPPSHPLGSSGPDSLALS